MNKKLRYIMMLLLMMITAGASANEVSLIDYPTSKDGTAAAGTTVEGTVKINADKTSVSCYSLKNGYNSKGEMTGNHIELTLEGGFKSGDVITVAGAINNSDESKWGTVVLFSANGKAPSVINTFEDFINGNTEAGDPVEQTYTLEQDYDMLYLGRDGNTATNVTLIKVVRNTSQKQLTLSFPESSYTAREGKTFESPELEYTGATEEEFATIASQITYTSSVEDVATVDAGGAVTIVAEGNTTITATFPGNDEFLAAKATYDLTVINKYAPDLLIDYPNTKDGTEVSGTTVEGTVKIKSNKNSVPCYSLKNGYNSNGEMTGNHIVLEVTGGFKKGDVLTVAGAINTTDETKRGTVVLFSANGKAPSVINTFEDFINGNTEAGDPVEQTYTLEQDYDMLYLGRDGNTATNVTLITMKRIPPLFKETFDNIDGTGGNDDTYTGTVASAQLKTDDTATDEVWATLDKVYKGKQCAKFGTGSANGTLTTPEITVQGDYGLTFRAAGWGTGTNNLSVEVTSAEGNTVTEEITLTNGAWKNYTIALDNFSGTMVIKFTGKRGFIDDIMVSEGKIIEKEDIELSFDPTALEVEMGEEFTEPTLTTPDDFDGTVTYSIDNEEVATIDATTGKLTLVGAGTAKVTATTSETDKYYEGFAFYDLTVIEDVLYDIAGIRSLQSGSIGTLKFDNAQVLYKGSTDMFVKDASGAIDFYKTTDFTYETGQILNGTAKVTYTLFKGLPEITKVEDADVTATAGTAVPTEDEIANVTLDKYVCDLIKVTGTFKVSGKNFFVTDGTNEIQLYNKFNITECNMAEVKDGAEVTATGILVPYNGNPEIYLTALEVEEAEVITAEITNVGYATLYYGTKALTVPTGVTAYTATVSEKTIVPGTTYNEGDVIPAGEAVILQGPAGEYEFEVDAANTATPTTGNMLYGFDTAATTTGPDGSAFYKLAVGPQGVGFYPGATGGAAFTSAANKAYLAVPKSLGASFFLFETDGIDVITYGFSTNDVIYNLEGVRMDATNLSKGIYIVNGKKIIVK